MLRDGHSHMGGSDDMKSGVVKEILCEFGDFIFMFLGLDLEYTLRDMFVHC